ncbi:hypothetical protein Zmor_017017 [Zophobas morio]|uniref:Sorbitol dehydrogenase n=1 Tax=Zophobas morio TaxID=2755281 RepID=A0AA38I806_9CUCU|nr:hypothetical protein Zmor_017017 [Zophobas morio]
MDAIQFRSEEQKIECVTVPVPVITHPREVLVKVAYSGVCGTDLHIIHGAFPCNPRPLTLGHEFSATVVDYGPLVTTLSKGDHVIVDPNSACHKCHFCHTGNPHFCTTGGFYANLGVKNHGGWGEYCLCSIEQVYKLPTTISLKTAALAEPVSCISHGWDLVSPLPLGGDVLVIGAGIIGTLWACLLHLHGHRRVTVVELNARRRHLIGGLMGEMGYDVVAPEDVKMDGGGFDLVVDCSGYGPAVEKGVELLKSGGKICMFGVAPPGVKISVSPYMIYMKELTLLSVKVNPFSFTKAVALVEAMADKYLDYDKLGIKVFKLREFQEALKALKNGDITKAIFEV